MAQSSTKGENIVTEAVDGILAASGGRLARPDGHPRIRVVLRTDWDRSKVALVSGGGSGHDPAHAGFVGHGMLTAAVCGDVFASPSVGAVLAGIVSVTGPAECLRIIKNDAGDRLNFGLAAERARAFGLKVGMVVADGDIALPHLPRRRGVAGTLLVRKITGASAESGADLGAVAETAARVIAQIRSIGMSLDACTGARVAQGRAHPARQGGTRARHSWRGGDRAGGLRRRPPGDGRGGGQIGEHHGARAPCRAAQQPRWGVGP